MFVCRECLGKVYFVFVRKYFKYGIQQSNTLGNNWYHLSRYNI